jgi:Tfp pilus assembly protein PilX
MTKMHSQRGAVLLVSLIMLVLLTLFAISALNTSTTSLKMAGNMQARSEATNAAQDAIETVISTPLFASNPSNAVVNPCGAPNTLCIDKDGNSVTNPASAYYVTKLIKTTPSATKPTPACVTVIPIKISKLDISDPSDLSCSAGQGQQFGVAGAVTGDSLCANSVWEITAQTTATATGATATVTQGLGIRISTDDMATSCL